MCGYYEYVQTYGCPFAEYMVIRGVQRRSLYVKEVTNDKLMLMDGNLELSGFFRLSDITIHIGSSGEPTVKSPNFCMRLGEVLTEEQVFLGVLSGDL